MSAKGLRDELFNRLTQQGLARISRDALASDLKHDGHSERRNPPQGNMPDLSANALQELVKAADIDEAGRRIGEGGAKKNVVRLVKSAPFSLNSD